MALIHYLLSAKYVTNTALSIRDTWIKDTICAFKELTIWGRERKVNTVLNNEEPWQEMHRCFDKTEEKGNT